MGVPTLKITTPYTCLAANSSDTRLVLKQASDDPTVYIVDSAIALHKSISLVGEDAAANVKIMSCGRTA